MVKYYEHDLVLLHCQVLPFTHFDRLCKNERNRDIIIMISSGY